MAAAMDAFASKVLDPYEGDGEEQKNADDVYDQLKGDFPEDAIAWVKDVSWEGPVDVPVEEVDMSARPRWRASREPDKVREFAAIMRRGGDELKPVLFVHWLGADKLFCIDGHHRLLAGEQSGGSVKGFVAEVPQAAGPWLTMHARQNHGPSEGEVDSSPGWAVPSGIAG